MLHHSLLHAGLVWYYGWVNLLHPHHAGQPTDPAVATVLEYTVGVCGTTVSVDLALARVNLELCTNCHHKK